MNGQTTAMLEEASARAAVGERVLVVAANAREVNRLKALLGPSSKVMVSSPSDGPTALVGRRFDRVLEDDYAARYAWENDLFDELVHFRRELRVRMAPQAPKDAL